MAYKRKTRDTWELQANYGFGHGWETECTEYSRTEARARLKEYRENAPGYSYRIVSKREKLS